jgi:hypothetical protein
VSNKSPSRGRSRLREEISARDPTAVRLQKGLPRRRPLRRRRNPVRFQDPRHRSPADSMADVLQRADDPGVAPCRVLFGHPHHQARISASTPGRPSRRPRVRPFPCDEPPRPAQQRVRASRSWRSPQGGRGGSCGRHMASPHPSPLNRNAEGLTRTSTDVRPNCVRPLNPQLALTANHSSCLRSESRVRCYVIRRGVFEQPCRAPPP